MKFGYARVSTSEEKQDINRQIRLLKEEGVVDTYFDFQHGDNPKKENLCTLLDIVQPGDTIITTEVSRLARSTKQLCEIIDIVKEKKICLQILGSITVDCRNGTIDPMTNAFIQMSGVFAELELLMIRERVKSGMANAREKGSVIGRPKLTKDDIPVIFYRHYPSYLNGTMNLSELSRITQLSRNTCYKYISLLKESQQK